MRAKSVAPDVLAAEMRTILLRGPWAVGLTLTTMPDHDTLRAAWARHGEALMSSLPRGKKAWFIERDWFVRFVRGEAPCD